MNNQDKTNQKASSGSGAEGALVRVGASTTGCAVVGAAIAGMIVGPAGSIVGAIVGGSIGLAASVTDTIRSSKE
jgi:hypothetical protein